MSDEKSWIRVRVDNSKAKNDIVCRQIFALIRASLWQDSFNYQIFRDDKVDWSRITKIALEQTVGGLMFSSALLLPKELLPKEEWIRKAYAFLAAFIWGLKGLRDNTISFGIMTAYLQLAGQIQRPLAEIARLLPCLLQSHTSISRILEIENIPAKSIGNETTYGKENDIVPGLERNSLPLGIEINNISFAYHDNQRIIFQKFSHTFNPGSLTAIIGKTGVGKSTLLRLILTLIKLREGSINFFHMENGKKSLLTFSGRSIVYVPQGNSLMSGTIRKNLLLGNPEASEADLWEAIHSAAADFVAELESGFDTKCGERGSGLSEGQAQRIAIARALLQPGSIILLDEISSSLDEETETLLLRRLTERKGSHTILFVTHRRGVLPFCDDILQL